jgi:hypothetical protein
MNSKYSLLVALSNLVGLPKLRGKSKIIPSKNL